MTTRRDFLGGFLLPSLTNAWFADRAPGAGKLLIVNGVTTGVNGVVALGQPGSGGSSTPPATYASLPDAGTTIPPPGSSSRSSFLVVFAAATGFNGNSSITIPKGTSSTQWAFSGWLNYGVLGTFGFTPSPTANGGQILRPAGSVNDGAGNSCAAFELLSYKNPGTVPGLYVAGDDNATLFQGFTWPVDSLANQGAGWVHLMVSLRLSVVTLVGPVWEYKLQVVAYANDTQILNATTPVSTPSWMLGAPTVLDFNDILNAGIFFGSDSTTPTNNGLYAGVAEIWEAPGQYVDWSVAANRYKFHTSDGFAPLETFAPVNLGPTGALPTGKAPRLYLSGPPSLFPNNRASGSLLTVNGASLVLIDDLPT